VVHAVVRPEWGREFVRAQRTGPGGWPEGWADEASDGGVGFSTRATGSAAEKALCGVGGSSTCENEALGDGPLLSDEAVRESRDAHAPLGPGDVKQGGGEGRMVRR